MILLQDLKPFVTKYFNDFTSSVEVWDYMQDHPMFLQETAKEIDEAVEMFNTYRKSKDNQIHNIPLQSSSYLKAILREDLPTTEKVIQMIYASGDKEMVEKIMKDISGFDFIDTLKPVEHCVAALLLGSYRCGVRILYPYIAEKNAQVASSLEEMIGLMALEKRKTKLFDALRHWYKDYEAEGFSREFSEAVQKL